MMVVDRKPADRLAAIVPGVLHWARTAIATVSHPGASSHVELDLEERRFRRACAVFEITAVAGLLLLLGITISMALLR